MGGQRSDLPQALNRGEGPLALPPVRNGAHAPCYDND